MEKLTLVGWKSFDNEYPTRKINMKEFAYILNLIQKDIAKNAYMFSGADHQSSLNNCAPIFSDGTCFRASMRCWGTIMASIYKGENREKLSYMDFYMSTPQELILPEEKEICVTPKEINEDPVGYYTKEDVDVLAQALNFDLEFMTTDKVLQKMYKEMMSDN